MRLRRTTLNENGRSRNRQKRPGVARTVDFIVELGRLGGRSKVALPAVVLTPLNRLTGAGSGYHLLLKPATANTYSSV